jgi:hypothetical protein
MKEVGSCMKKTVLLFFVLSFFSGLLSANVVILNNKRQINVKSYRVEGDLVYITLEDGVVYSVRKETVDLDLTQRANDALARSAGAEVGEANGPKTLVEVAGEPRPKRAPLQRKRKFRRSFFRRERGRTSRFCYSRRWISTWTKTETGPWTSRISD